MAGEKSAWCWSRPLHAVRAVVVPARFGFVVLMPAWTALPSTFGPVAIPSAPMPQQPHPLPTPNAACLLALAFLSAQVLRAAEGQAGGVL